MEKLDQAYPALLNFTNRNLRRYSNERLKRSSLNLTVDQWGVLKLLEEHGGSMTVAGLSERMLKDKPTLTGIIDILVRARLVVRAEDAADRRRIVVRLTKSGQRKVVEASSLVSGVRRDLGRGLTKKDHADLKRILSKINANIERARSR